MFFLKYSIRNSFRKKMSQVPGWSCSEYYVLTHIASLSTLDHIFLFFKFLSYGKNEIDVKYFFVDVNLDIK